jgi:hypothetical protein
VNIILLTVMAVVIGGLPLAAALLVTLASRREETARSIAGRAPGPLAGAARRLLGFHAVGISRPACRARAPYRNHNAARRASRFPASNFPAGGSPGAGLPDDGPRAAPDAARVPAGARVPADRLALASGATPGR